MKKNMPRKKLKIAISHQPSHLSCETPSSVSTLISKIAQSPLTAPGESKSGIKVSITQPTDVVLSKRDGLAAFCSGLGNKLANLLRWSFVDNPTFTVPYITFACLVSILFPYAAIGFGVFVLMVMAIEPLRNIIHEYRHFLGFMLSTATSLILWPVLAGVAVAKTLGGGLSWIEFAFLEGIKNVSFQAVITAAYTTAISVLTFAASTIVVAFKELIYNPCIKPHLTCLKNCRSSAAITPVIEPAASASRTSVSATPSASKTGDWRHPSSASGTGRSGSAAWPAPSSVMPDPSSHTNTFLSSGTTLPAPTV